MLSFLKEFLSYLKKEKKLWLSPLLLSLILIGFLLLLAQGSVLAPLIYTLF